MSILFILLAALGAQLAVLGARHLTRRKPTHPDLPGLDDVLKLAKHERGPFGLRWLPKRLELRLSGVLLNDGPMISENWPKLLVPGLRKIFHTRLRSREQMFKRTQIFSPQTSQRAFEEMQGIGELGTDGWTDFEKTGRTSYAGFDPGFLTRLEHREFTKGVIVRRKLIDDNLYAGAGIPNSVTGRVSKLADSLALFREKSAADVFKFAFTDSGVDSAGFPVAGADGVGLCSTAHPLSPTDSTTQSNEGTLALTKDNVKTTRLAMRRFTDDKGDLVSMNPDTLLVPPELEDAALVINQTPQVPGSANNDINPERGRWNIVVWDYLLDPNAWFMLDKMLADEHLVWLERVAPEFAADFDFDTQQAQYPAYNRFSRGFDAWQWVFGHNPS